MQATNHNHITGCAEKSCPNKAKFYVCVIGSEADQGTSAGVTTSVPTGDEETDAGSETNSPSGTNDVDSGSSGTSDVDSGSSGTNDVDSGSSGTNDGDSGSSGTNDVDSGSSSGGGVDTGSAATCDGGLTQAQRDLIVESHNEYRRQAIAEGACNMQRMVITLITVLVPLVVESGIIYLTTRAG